MAQVPVLPDVDALPPPIFDQLPPLDPEQASTMVQSLDLPMPDIDLLPPPPEDLLSGLPPPASSLVAPPGSKPARAKPPVAKPPRRRQPAIRATMPAGVANFDFDKEHAARLKASTNSPTSSANTPLMPATRDPRPNNAAASSDNPTQDPNNTPHGAATTTSASPRALPNTARRGSDAKTPPTKAARVPPPKAKRRPKPPRNRSGSLANSPRTPPTTTTQPPPANLDVLPVAPPDAANLDDLEVPPPPPDLDAMGAPPPPDLGDLDAMGAPPPPDLDAMGAPPPPDLGDLGDLGVPPLPLGSVPPPEFPESPILLTLVHDGSKKLIRATLNTLVSKLVVTACDKAFLPAAVAPQHCLRLDAHGVLDMNKRIGEYMPTDRDAIYLEPNPMGGQANLAMPSPVCTPQPASLPSSFTTTSATLTSPRSDGGFLDISESDSLPGSRRASEEVSAASAAAAAAELFIQLRYLDNVKLVRWAASMSTRDALANAMSKMFLGDLDPATASADLPYRLYHLRLKLFLEPDASLARYDLGNKEQIELRATEETLDRQTAEATFVLSVHHAESGVDKLVQFRNGMTVAEAIALVCGKFFLPGDPSGYELVSNTHGSLAPGVLVHSITMARFGFADRDHVSVRAVQIGGGAVGQRSSTVLKTIESSTIICVIHDPTNRIKLMKLDNDQTTADIMENAQRKFALDSTDGFNLETDRHGVLQLGQPLSELNFRLKEKVYLRRTPVLSPAVSTPGSAASVVGNMRIGLPSAEATATPYSAMFGDDEEAPEFLRSGVTTTNAAAAAGPGSPAGKDNSDDELSLLDTPASPAELFRRLLLLDGSDHEHHVFESDFLLTYRSFMHPLEFMQYLVMEIHPEFIPEEDLLITPIENDPIMEAQLPREQRSRRAVSMFKQWLSEHFHDFVIGSDLRRTTRTLINEWLPDQELPWLPEEEWDTVKADLKACFAQALEDEKNNEDHTQWIPSDDTPDWKSFTARELAEQMTKWEHQMFSKIQPKECLGGAWSRDDRDVVAPNITKLITSFNTVSAWVVTEILMEKKLKSRASTLNRFIDLCQELMTLKNFNGVMEIMAALQSSPIARLAKTWGKVPQEKKDKLHYLGVLMSQERNYAYLRQTLKTTALPCLPYLGLYLSDLVFTNDGNPDYTPEGLVNWSKWRQFGAIIKRIQKYQHCDVLIAQNPLVRHWLESGLVTMDEDEAYKLSLEREPRKKKKKKR